MSKLTVNGFEIYKTLIAPEDQAALRDKVRAVAQAAPFFTPTTKGGKPMSVRITSAGRVGWHSGPQGYRYLDRHPAGGDWPVIPPRLLELWTQVTGLDRWPDSCLINYYGEGARMGLHQDSDEVDFAFPVVSVSLGDDALFRMGGVERSDPTRSVWLHSGDVVVMGGAARLAYHGIDRIRFGSSALLPKGGRINLTLRVIGSQVE